MNVKIVAALAFQLEFALPIPMPFNHNPTLTRAEQDMWNLCIGLSGGSVILTALVVLFTWVSRIGVHPRHVQNILQMITIMILAGGFIRSILLHGDNWAYYYILGTVLFIALAYSFGCLVACLSGKIKEHVLHVLQTAQGWLRTGTNNIPLQEDTGAGYMAITDEEEDL